MQLIYIFNLVQQEALGIQHRSSLLSPHPAYTALFSLRYRTNQVPRQSKKRIQKEGLNQASAETNPTGISTPHNLTYARPHFEAVFAQSKTFITTPDTCEITLCDAKLRQREKAHNKQLQNVMKSARVGDGRKT